jgi:glycosyltransferase 2 family protein
LIKNKKYLDIFLYIFVIVSLVFLTRYLKQKELLYIPHQIKTQYLVISLLSLCAGFYCNCQIWKIVLQNNGIRISLKSCALSIGISIFGKYIPGKVWLITGMSGKVSQMTGAPLGKITFLSTLLQIMIIMAGATVGMISMIAIVKPIYLILIYAFIIILGALFFKFKNKIAAILDNSSSKLLSIWVKSFVHSISLSLIMMMVSMWICWSAGFYFLSISLLPNILNPMLGFCFAFAASIGILVVIAPGGLGVREGLLGVLLKGFIDSPKDATTLAAFSRLWFLLGEIFMFLTAIVLIIINMREKVKKQ